MKRLLLTCAILGVVVGMAPAMFADVTDYLLNVNGTSYCPGSSTVTCSNYGGLAAVPGLVSSLDTSNHGTGLGTVTLTYNPGAGTYNVDFWLFEQLSQPGWNEYSKTGGSAAAGQSWQIDVPDYDYIGELGTPGAGTIIANTQAGTLADTNFIPGSDSSYAGGGFCSTVPDANCNDYTSLAMGFGFTLTTGQEEVVKFTVSTTQPTSGLYLEQIHPVDGANGTETDYYFTGSASTEPVGPPTIPEPGSWILLATSVALVLSRLRRRSANGVRMSGDVLETKKA